MLQHEQKKDEISEQIAAGCGCVIMVVGVVLCCLFYGIYNVNCRLLSIDDKLKTLLDKKVVLSIKYPERQDFVKMGLATETVLYSETLPSEGNIASAFGELPIIQMPVASCASAPLK